MSRNGKLNLPRINSIYLAFFSLTLQKRLVQTKLYYKLFYYVWKEMSHKPSKVAGAKNFFASVYVIGTACFDECILFHVIITRHYLYKFSVTLRFFPIAMLLSFFKQAFRKRSVFYIRYLHNNITMLLIPKVQTKASTS